MKIFEVKERTVTLINNLLLDRQYFLLKLDIIPFIKRTFVILEFTAIITEVFLIIFYLYTL